MNTVHYNTAFYIKTPWNVMVFSIYWVIFTLHKSRDQDSLIEQSLTLIQQSRILIIQSDLKHNLDFGSTDLSIIGWILSTAQKHNRQFSKHNWLKPIHERHLVWVVAEGNIDAWGITLIEHMYMFTVYICRAFQWTGCISILAKKRSNSLVNSFVYAHIYKKYTVYRIL